MNEASSKIPHGYGPIFRTSPLLDVLGNFYSRGVGKDLEIGLLVDQRHTNARGSLHGGVIATLADTGAGYLLAFGSDTPRRLVTVSLAVDYIASASLGDWIEIRLESSEVTGRLVFSAAKIVAGEVTIARARILFSIVG